MLDLNAVLSKEGCLLSEDVERCLVWSGRFSRLGDTDELSMAPGDGYEIESRFGVFGPPILESRFLSYA